jgi:hypothetical protein
MGTAPTKTYAMITLAELWKYEVYTHNYDCWPGMALWSGIYHTYISILKMCILCAKVHYTVESQSKGINRT